MTDILVNYDQIILFGALLLIVGVLTTKFSSRIGVPALVLFIAVGMIAGSEVLDFFYLSNAYFAQMVGVVALVSILFEGGMQTNWKAVKPVIKPSLSLATLGVVVTAGLVGVAAKMILGVSWLEGMLVGAIVGSTDASAVFVVLKGKNINPKLGSTLEAESGSNDPMAMFLTIALIQFMTASDASLWTMIGFFLWQMGIGLILGLLFGRLAAFSINHISLESSGLYPVFTLAFALVTYSLTDLVNASGLLAVYIAAVVIGNSELTYRHSIFHFNEGFAWMMQILMFVMLGLLVFPSELFTFDVMTKGILLSVILIIVARPVAVFLTTIKMNYTLKEKIFLSWAGLKGAVPIVLATFPLIAGLEHSQEFFNIVFFVVLISALVQGSSIARFAEKLGLTGPTKVDSPHSLELISIGKANAEIIEYEVNEATPFIDRTLQEIEFPRLVSISAIIRAGRVITPAGMTKVLAGDILYILVSRKSKRELEKLLAGQLVTVKDKSSEHLHDAATEAPKIKEEESAQETSAAESAQNAEEENKT